MSKVIEYVVWLVLAYVNIWGGIRCLRDGSDPSAAFLILVAALSLLSAMRVAITDHD